MGSLIDGDDGLPTEEVGIWAKEKHDRLRRYLDISRGTRKKWLGPGKAGTTFIDLFCGPGRARVKETGEWIEGSAVAAWNISQKGGAPFSDIYVADINNDRRAATVERLTRLRAPVRELAGSAVDAAAELARTINPYGLHFAFIDPFSLGALDFKIIQSFSTLKRMDMLIHISKMDHQRNLDINLQSDESALDRFVPGWRERIDGNHSQQEIRRQIVEYWQELVRGTGKRPSTDWNLIKGSRGQHLYWLLLVAEHDLAHKFWNVATDDGQGSLF
jgi:three-Cys-motif partner protein